MFKHRLEVLYVYYKRTPVSTSRTRNVKKTYEGRLIASVNNMDFNAAINLLEDNKNIFMIRRISKGLSLSDICMLDYLSTLN